MAVEQLGVKNKFCLGGYCSVQPRPLAVDLDSGFVNRDPPRLRRRRVGYTVSQPMYPVSDRTVGAFNA